MYQENKTFPSFLPPFLHSLTVQFLEEHGRPTANDLALGHDGNAVAQDVCLVHEVGGEDDGAPLPVVLEDRPDLSPGSRIHPRCRFVQEHDLAIQIASHTHFDIKYHLQTIVYDTHTLKY